MALEFTAERILFTFFGLGFVWLLNLTGVLALTLPGRLWPAVAGPLGFGRHVEALLLMGILTTYVQGGIGNVPVWVDEGGIVSFSIVGAILPTILSLHFLGKAGWAAGLASLIGIAVTAYASWAISHPEPDLGIVAYYPEVFLPALVAGIFGALIGNLLAPNRLHSVGIAYACGSLGALIGADLVRFDVVLRMNKVAGSFGGADAQDLVFTGGLWGAAIASLSLLGYARSVPKPENPWEGVTALTRKGDLQVALAKASALAENAVQQWASARGLEGKPRDELIQLAHAEGAFALAREAAGNPLFAPKDVQPVLENLESLCRRLARPPFPTPAPTGARVAAALLDALVPLAVAVAAFFFASQIRVDPNNETGIEPGALGILVPTLFAVWWGIAAHILYGMTFEWATNGLTPGKMATRIRARRVDGARLTGWDCAVRNVARLLDLPMLYLLAFAAPPNHGRQRLGDYFSDTVVVSVTSKNPAAYSQTATPVATAPKAIAMAASTGTRATSRAPR